VSPIYAVIVAGGQGTRMGTAVPKQFLELAGKPVLAHTIQAFINAVPDIHLVLVLPAQQLSWAQMILQSFPDRLDIELVTGGDSRFGSVKNGLTVVPDDAIVLVHDGVRCLITPALITRCIQGAQQNGSAIPVVPVADSVRQLNGKQSSPLNRELLRAIQTPQTFLAEQLKKAFEQPYSDVFTDEATVIEAAGGVAHLVEGERSNLKITTPEDLILAEAILNSRNFS
jgi:2-C-methyl-D-erythritol 4-phosphate cytidylyltransferase